MQSPEEVELVFNKFGLRDRLVKLLQQCGVYSSSCDEVINDIIQQYRTYNTETLEEAIDLVNQLLEAKEDGRLNYSSLEAFASSNIPPYNEDENPI